MWLCKPLVALTFLPLVHGIGKAHTFGLYGGVTVEPATESACDEQ
jgi:hypothetical protein